MYGKGHQAAWHMEKRGRVVLLFTGLLRLGWCIWWNSVSLWARGRFNRIFISSTSVTLEPSGLPRVASGHTTDLNGWVLDRLAALAVKVKVIRNITVTCCGSTDLCAEPNPPLQNASQCKGKQGQHQCRRFPANRALATKFEPNTSFGILFHWLPRLLSFVAEDRAGEKIQYVNTHFLKTLKATKCDCDLCSRMKWSEKTTVKFNCIIWVGAS